MTNYDYQNTTNRIKVVLLRTPIVVPKMSHVFSICPPLGLAYVAAAIQKANFEVNDVYVGITGDHINCMNYKGTIRVNNSSHNSGIGSEISNKDIERVLEQARAINMPPGRRILHTLSQSFEVDDRKGIQNPIGLSGNTLSVKVHLVTSQINVEKDIEKK